jgi:hypothetical protein
MVRLTAQDPVVTYRVLDGEGAAIGEVRQPSSAPVVGWGAETVLLVRNEDRSQLFSERATAA